MKMFFNMTKKEIKKEFDTVQKNIKTVKNLLFLAMNNSHEELDDKNSCEELNYEGANVAQISALKLVLYALTQKSIILHSLIEDKSNGKDKCNNED